MASGFLILISFFTRIPVGSKIRYNESDFKKALGLYALMGGIIGILMFMASFAVDMLHVQPIKGLLLTICYTVITGGIHLDGSADTSDGIFSGRTGERIFEIMSDSHIGAFGVLCLMFIILSQFVLFSYVDMFVCFLFPIVGRTATVVGSWNKKYAKKSKGMGTIFIESIDGNVFMCNILILLVSCLILPNRIIVTSAAFISLTIAYFISNWIEKKIGGMTGDTCGFITEVTQIIFMITVVLLEGLMQ